MSETDSATVSKTLSETISAPDALDLIKSGSASVDVRSQGEFAKGSLFHVRNIPILNDQHRHLVGLTYKEAGQNQAIELGHQLVDPLRPTLVAGWRQVLQTESEERRILFCWRGGLRSAIAAEWLKESGLVCRRVIGGYKTMRQELLKVIEAPPPLIVLTGLTGSGKTELLGRLRADWVLDLEGLAAHRGSSFGARPEQSQPTQQNFENQLGLALWRTAHERVIEDESRCIGQITLSRALFHQMSLAPRVVLEDTLINRTARTFREYVELPIQTRGRAVTRESLFLSLRRLERRLGGLRHKRIQSEMVAAFQTPEIRLESHRAWIESLLREYYDPLYEHGLKQNRERVLFSGDLTGVHDFLTTRFGGRRP